MISLFHGNFIDVRNLTPYQSFYHNKYANKEAAWEAFKRIWFKENPPLDNGYYMCGIGGEWVHESEVTLDHINGRDGALMFDPDNIQPSCGYHNYRKGSRRWKARVDKETYDFLNLLSRM